ncbi:Pkinase-domain-containing protein [Durotheca rogersii]|uniref:Pkinase-domain-containing protein n=1 Tax=Durotheca rogersii TaxID=419775 RepID=UPI00221F4C0B|nr:Pkinase-domain-containing protein [Durotheca rogersii]KAI5861093.1 Pkinase-domain-containing protein [Durotheca rogersii]
MTDDSGPAFRAPRAPLGDATNRINNAPSPTKPIKSSHAPTSQIDPLGIHPTKVQPRQDNQSNQSNPHTSERPQEAQDDGKRRPSIRTTGRASSGGRRKTHIGPWELGKSLGNGSAARVRLVRHTVTSELAAVKILSKNPDILTHPGSIAQLDQWDRTREEYGSENRMPFAIEREVAILKLIDHPNIVKLYDIWENRSEIYLVLEYVQRGDLYGYLSQHGPLSEVETIFYFRQLLSALEYVHSFNLCHRDLKPENILLTEDGRVKVTDFGMSALHQGPNHMLRTSCGSPHYAAPEIVSSASYRGDRVDIWSLGVILYACLTNSLPFYDNDMQRLLHKVQKGVYRMPTFTPYEQQDLIARMLKVDPEERISTRKLWLHPLVRKYDHLDDFNDGECTQEYRQNGRYDPVRPDELDMQTLRQLKSVWHTFTEQQLAGKLTSPERNDFKLFYWLLYNYREKRLENYGGDIAYSASDYHHLQPLNWKKKYTTLEFQGKPGKNPPRFTVISNVATNANGEALETASTDGGATVKSYDPYKSSRIMEDVVASRARIVIHRDGTNSTRGSRPSSARSRSARANSEHSRLGRGARHPKGSTALGGSRRSVNSIRSGEEILYRRPASRQRRNIDFSHVRKRSADQSESACRPTSIAGDDTTYDRDHTSPTSPARRTERSNISRRSRSETQSMTDVSKSQDGSLHWNEELRHFSRSIAKDCDDAFNSSLLSLESCLGEISFESPMSEGAGAHSTDPNTLMTSEPNTKRRPWDTRSLPPPPPHENSDTEMIVAVKERTERPKGAMDKTPAQINKPMFPVNQLGRPDRSLEKSEADRRVTSAPIYSQFSTQWGRDKIPLPPIDETPKEDDCQRDDDRRAVSAPISEPWVARHTMAEEHDGLEYLARHQKTIRLVTSPSDRPRKPTVLDPHADKKLPRDDQPNSQDTQGPNIRQQYWDGETKATTPQDPPIVSKDGSSGSIKKKGSWFRRSSKGQDDMPRSGSSKSNIDGLTAAETNSSTGSVIPLAKKKGFGFSFWRGGKVEPQLRLSLAESDFDFPSSLEPVRAPGRPKPPRAGSTRPDKAAARNIEPQRNWLARLFRVKPATRHFCFVISRRRARQEIANLFREWKRFGVQDVVVDKERNLVFARVAKENSLNLKEACFAAEIMAVIEHGKRNRLSIARFTQERGAASTFNKVMNTMESIFASRAMLVTEKRKVKMMMKTLDS